MKRMFAIFLLTHLTLSVAAISQVAEITPVNTRKMNVAKVQYGTASFYADKFEGKRTANGDVFTQKGMTAAHNSLPLGTWIRVTNLSNKKTVVVKVNDRLHHKNTRLVDLSKAAAKKLGYTGKGLSKVRVDVLGKNPDNIALR
ncbi:MAG TPA: septal ring lytic transglycosylase RlpA family protein [Chitinophagaceae bacterium]|nr:septal ring lytic transglycosylase RlpA family protein [Chitinophagaceae bacterium]